MAHAKHHFSISKIALFAALFAIFMGTSVHAEDLKSLEEVRNEIHGPNYLNPSPDSLVGKYIAETGAATTTRQFWRAPENYVMPPHELGPKRLIIAVSAETFPIFRKYFSSKHFLFLLNEHGNFAAFEGKRSAPGMSYWNGQNLTAEFTMPDINKMAIPMILSSSEGARAEKYFELASHFPDGRTGLARLPWDLRNRQGDRYCSYGAWSTGCGTWIGNMPIGDELVDEYYFPSGDGDGSQPNHSRLISYKAPRRLDRETEKLLHEVWTVPGHKQLAEVLDPGANRRGEFENAGWTTYTFIGSAPTERVPLIFYFVEDAKKPIPPNFIYQIEDPR